MELHIQSFDISRISLMRPQLLSKPKFSGVEKIKTIGSTYMAATGLNVTPGPDGAQVLLSLGCISVIISYLDSKSVRGHHI